jgi:hypothetical protein
MARGLINLGLLVRAPSEGLMSDEGGYSAAPFVVKLLELLEGATRRAMSSMRLASDT